MEFILTVAEVAMVFGFSIGYLWGEAFSGFDGQIKHESEWFKKQNPIIQWFVESLLDATHHFQYGLALILWVMVKLPPDSIQYLVLIRLGWGLVASDWKDYQNVLRRAGFNTQEDDQ